MTNSGLAKEQTMHVTAVENIAPQAKGPPKLHAGFCHPRTKYKSTGDQAEAQLAEAQKAINAPRQLLATPTQ
jgi:hypothetical protein